MSDVEWREVVGHPGYWVSSDGDLRNPDGQPMRPWPCNKHGHLQIGIDGKRMLVHRIVLEAYVGVCPSGMEGRHVDDNPRHNAISNLKWGTRSDNMQDSIMNGSFIRGEKHPFAKLTMEKVMEIREQLGKKSLRALGREHGVSDRTIRDIADGITWKHI